VRKLLVASQKGGVGKTTTSMNLAAAAALSGTRVLLLDADPLSNISSALNLHEHPHRQSLRQAGIQLPGVLVTNFVPGLDVLSPYEEGRCSDADLDYLLQVLASPPAQECYGCMIVDVPPFMGANPTQLLASCEQFILVMRAEAHAYRTLPAFLELVQRSSSDGHTIQLCGILLTLPEGEELNGRWERELRGRLGARILPEVIPHDETITKALRVGPISSHQHPDSPAACQYRRLVGKLGLTAEARPPAAAEKILEALRTAAASISPPAVPVSERTITETPPSTNGDSKEVDLFNSVTEPEPSKPAAPPSSRVRRQTRSGELLRPARPERPAAAAATPIAPSSRFHVTATSSDPSISPPAPTQPAPAPAPAPNALGQLWPLWILLGAVLGGGLRFFALPPTLLPVLVGLGVALIVVVVLLAMAAQDPSGSAGSDGSRSRSRRRESRHASGRIDPRKEPAARVNSRAKSASASAHREPHTN
jgi:chromosome partitioning protein